MKILVSGAAGFVGANLVKHLLETETNVEIVGLDNINDYYDVRVKQYRLSLVCDCAALHPENSFVFVKGSINDRPELEKLFSDFNFDIVVNLAAQAGVRYSADNPEDCMENNVYGFFNLIEACRRHQVKRFVFASSSSVYGDSPNVPFREEQTSDRPVSLYAATKKCDELIARVYSGLYGMNCTGLRLFTVYGPAGRPDMAYYSFSDKLTGGEKIQLYNHGKCRRDFTYIDDAVGAIAGVIHTAPKSAYSIYNIGSSRPESVLNFVHILCGKLVETGVLPPDFDLESHIEMLPMQPWDVPDTCADISAIAKDFGYEPHTSLNDGLGNFALWYKDYHK